MQKEFIKGNRWLGVCLSILIGLFVSIDASSNQNYNIKYLTTKQGLSNNYVTCGCEDNKGFIWFGTRDGLNRWDGYEIKVYRTEKDNPFSLPDNFIRSIASDYSGNLWIGTSEAGAIRYNIQEEKFYSYSIDYNGDETFPSGYVKNIFVDSDTIIWFGTDNGLVKYNAEEDNFRRVFLMPKNVSSRQQELVIDIFKIDSSSFGVQSDIGLFKVENDLSEPLIIPLEIYNNNYLHGSNPVFYTEQKDVWFADPEVLYYYSDSTNTTIQIKHRPGDATSLSSNDVSKIFQDSQNNIWITTWDGGVNLFHSISDGFTVFSENDIGDLRLSNNVITNVFEDSYHNIWFTTEEGGVSYLSTLKNRMQYYAHDPFNINSLSGKKVGAFYQGEDDDIWIGTSDGGLNRFFSEEDLFTHHSVENQSIAPSILGIEKADDGSLYLTGWGLGLFKYNYQKNEFIDVFAGIPGLDNSDKYTINIKGFTVDEDGFVWLATHSKNGISIYDSKENCLYNTQNPGQFNYQLLSIPYPVSIYQDSRKRMWVTSYSGLYMFDGTYHMYRATENVTNSIGSNYIYSIYEDAEGVIWIGHSKGLDKIITTDTEVIIQSVSEKLQLHQNIKSIIGDNKGKLWLSSNLGITSYDVNNSHVSYFQFNNEAPVQEFVERSCFKSADGKLLFGTTDGFLMFHPDSLKDEIHDQPIYFTDFKIFNKSQKVNESGSPLDKSILYTDTIKLSYKQSVIGLEYVALDINSQGKVEYAYRLDGVDMNWNYAGYLRFTTYANLVPGEYTFRVRTANGGQLNNLHEAKIHFIIAPPFWKTKWAYTGYTLLFLLSLWFYRREVLNREELKNALKLEKVKIQSVQETNLMKLRFFTNVSHEFRTPLTLIKAPIEKLLQKKDRLSEKEKEFHYQMILNSTNRLDKMVTQLMDYRKLEAGSLVLEPTSGDIIDFCKSIWKNFEYLASQKNIQFKFHTNASSYIMAFDADKLEKVLSNLLSNSFKNTKPSKTIDLSVSHYNAATSGISSDVISIQVCDTGYGIPKENLPFIFDRFYMVSSEKSDTVKGTGIGLALTKELVEMHQGKITVESIVDEKTCFTVTIPVNISPKSETTIDDEPVGISTEILAPDSSHEKSTKGQPRNRLLVIDDDDEMLKFLERELEGKYQVLIARNGKEGETIAMNELPDLILSDVMMPLVNGIELCSKIKKNERTSHIPIILLTARYSQEKKIEGLESGANAYLMKPFNVEVLHLTVSNILKSRQELIDKFRNGTSLFFENQEVESSDQKLMQKAINIVLENITQTKINADFIAQRLFVSRTLLYLKIEALTGQTVSEFVNNIRLKKSKQLLLSDEHNISEVAFAVGFTSQSYFSRTFSKFFGYSPKEYIQENKTE